MKTRFPLWAAIGFVVVWGLMLLAVPLTMDVFKGFKVEMPAITMLLINACHLGGGFALPILLLATALLLALRQSAGWVATLIWCVLCDLAVIALVLPIAFVLMSALSAMRIAAPPVTSIPGLWIAVIALVLNQILFVLLLRKRRDFLVAPQSDGALLPLR